MGRPALFALPTELLLGCGHPLSCWKSLERPQEHPFLKSWEGSFQPCRCSEMLHAHVCRRCIFNAYRCNAAGFNLWLCEGARRCPGWFPGVGSGPRAREPSRTQRPPTRNVEGRGRLGDGRFTDAILSLRHQREKAQRLPYLPLF